MPRNSDGQMSVVSPPFAIPNTIPLSTDINAKINDIATEISDSLSRSGKGAMLQPLKLGGFKAVQMADGTAATDGATFGQILATSLRYANTVTTGDHVNEIIATFVPPLNLVVNREFRFVATAANTNKDEDDDPIEPTIDIDGSGPKTIKKGDGQPLLEGDIAGPGYVCACVWNGTDIILLNPAKLQDTTLYETKGEYVGINTRDDDELVYTLALDDKGKMVTSDSDNDVTFIVPPEPASEDDEDGVDFPVNSWIKIWQKTDGQIIVTPGSDVTLRAKDDAHLTAARNSVVELVKIGENDWLLWGDLTSSAPPLGGAPAIVDVTASEAINGVSQVITLPTSLLTGQLLVAAVANTNQATVTWPAGWTELSDQSDASGTGFAVAWHRCSGSEPATITVELSPASPTTHLVVRINDAHTTSAPEAGTPPASADINNPNPPSVTPTWGAANTLWLAFAKSRSAALTVSSYPVGYGLNQTFKAHSVGGTTDTMLAVAGRQLNAITEDPGAYTFSGVSIAQAQTVAIPPLSSVGPPGPTGGFPGLGTPASNINPAGTSHTVNMPSGVAAGNLLVAVVGCGANSSSITFPAGWTKFVDQTEGGNLRLAAAWKLAGASEPASITVTTGSSSPSCVWAGRFTNAFTTAAPNSSNNKGTSGAPNTGSITLTGGSQKALWLTFVVRNKETAPTAYPTNYGLHNLSVPNSTLISLSIAGREFQAATEDPGAFTFANTNQRYVVLGLGIRPAPVTP